MKQRSFCALAILALSFLFLLAFPIRMSTAAKETNATAVERAGQKMAATYFKLPLSFEANQGQTDARVKFLSRGSGYTLFLTGNEAVLSLQMPGVRNQKPSEDPAPTVLRMKLVGANLAARMTGLDELPGKNNYFLGSDPTKWRTNVPTYARVKYANVYPGVDVVYYGNQRQLEYDFVVSPGADPKAIAFELETAGPKLDANGDLVIATDAGEVRFRKPVVYQPALDSGARSDRLTVEGRFVLLASDRVGFEVPNYDKSRALIIDPVLAYSSFLGGSGAEGAGSCVGIAVDSDGNAYIVSGTASLDFPKTPGAFQTIYAGGPVPSTRYYPCGDAFLTKVDPTGSALVYSTYLGGSGCESGNGIGVAVDSHGSAYVAGSTDSTDFPTTANAFQTVYKNGVCTGSNECGDAFVTKFSPDGSSLEYSTYLGGSRNDLVDDTISVDLAGNAYVAGFTDSPDFPTTPGAFQATLTGQNCLDQDGNPIPCVDAFVTKLNAQGSALVYSTLIGGSASESTTASTVDSNGNVWITGDTYSSDFPTTSGAYQKNFHPQGCGVAPYIWDCDDVFVTKLNATGTGLMYSTYLGGLGGELSVGMAVDSPGNAYVTGITSSSDFPITLGAYQPTPPSSCPAGSAWWECSDAFVTKINPLRTGAESLIYSTFLGGTGNDWGAGIAVDPFGNAYVTGQTYSVDFPTRNPFQNANLGAGDVFISKLNPAGSDLIYSTFLGGTNPELADWMVIDRFGGLYLGGWTQSTDFPTTPGVFQSTYGGGTYDMFVAKISPQSDAQIQPPVELNGSSVFNAKRGVVPIRFTLTEDGDPTCDLYPATIAVFRVSATESVPVNESEFVMASDNASNFRIVGCQYEYNLSTRALGPGTFQVNISVGNVVVGQATFGLK